MEITINLVIKLFLWFTLVLEKVHCNENESSEMLRQDLIYLTPNVTRLVHSVNDSRMISCRGLDIRWINPWNRKMDNIKGRVHVEDSSLPNDELHELRLIFEKIGSNDYGNWTCMGNYGSTSFEMITYEPAEFLNYETDFTAIEWEEAFLRCEATGKPKPSIHWSFKENSISVHDHHYIHLPDGLKILNVMRNESGDYVCKAFQNASEMINFQERVVHLDVYYKPEFQDIKNDQKKVKYAYLNNSVELNCHATGNPLPDIIWHHNGKKASHNHVRTINGVSSLVFFLDSIDFYGEYKCTAKNIVGKTYSIIELKEGIRPPKPNEFKILGYGITSVEVLVKNENFIDVPMKVTMYRFEMMKKDKFEEEMVWKQQNIRDLSAANHSEFLVEKLMPNTSYVIKVACINAAGVGEWSDTLEFTTLAQVSHSAISAVATWQLITLILLLSF